MPTEDETPENQPTPEADATLEEPNADETDDSKSPNREAAKYRKALRDTEAQRDTLRSRIDTLMRGAIESTISNDSTMPKLHNPADLWDVAGVTVDAVTDDDGYVDPEKLSEALTEAQSQRPYLFQDYYPNGDPLHQVLSSATPVGKTSGDFGDALRSAHREAFGRNR